MRDWLTRIGRRTLGGVEELGLAAMMLVDTVYWIVIGPWRGQPVRAAAILAQALETGVKALPIVSVLSIAVGLMVAIQGIYTLRLFGAESQVTFGVALSLTREFSPLITGILVAGRSGSALAAKLGTMTINDEVNALTVMGIHPVRFLVAPAFVGMLVMIPALTWYANILGLLGAGLYISAELGISMAAYVAELRSVLSVSDVAHGLGKSVLFAVLITLVGVINGVSVTGGAEGIGRMTTRAVVQAISAIVITDMLFAFMVTRT